MKRNDTVYNASEAILSLSYGKDSIACLGAIEELGWPLHRIIHAEVWATDTIPADLPPMVEFKSKADAIIKERWGITVEHVCATTTYEEVFYKKFQSGKRAGQTIGFPHTMGAWCNSRLKVQALNEAKKLTYEDVFYQRFGQGKREGEIYGFPFLRGPWCNNKLKRDVLRAAERDKRLFGMLALPMMSLKGSLGSMKQTRYLRLLKSVGLRKNAGNGAKRTACCRRYTQRLRVAGAGSATIKVWISYASCAEITLNIGRCCSNGMQIALLPSRRTVIPCATMTAGFHWRTREL